MLFILWILSMQYLPAPVVLILFAALISGAIVTLSFALASRKAAAAAVAERDAAGEFLKRRQ